MEYWTSNKKLIELQNLWIDRHLAKFILENFNGYLEYDNFEKIINFDYKWILETMNEETIEYEEFQNFINSFID